MLLAAVNEPAKATVTVLEKVIVPVPAALTLIPSSVVKYTLEVTALAKVMDVPKSLPLPNTPRLILVAFTVPEAKNAPEPLAFKSPIWELPDPTLPEMVIVPAPAPVSSNRSLLATAASTLPVIVILPTPRVVILALVALLETRFPVISALAPAPTETRFAILVALFERVASEVKPPT